MNILQKALGLLSALMVSFMLTGCGGSGDINTTELGGTPTPTNNAIDYDAVAVSYEYNGSNVAGDTVALTLLVENTVDVAAITDAVVKIDLSQLHEIAANVTVNLLGTEGGLTQQTDFTGEGDGMTLATGSLAIGATGKSKQQITLDITNLTDAQKLTLLGQADQVMIDVFVEGEYINAAGDTVSVRFKGRVTLGELIDNTPALNQVVEITQLLPGDDGAPTTPAEPSNPPITVSGYGFVVVNDSTLQVVGLGAAQENAGAFQYDLSGATITSVAVSDDTCGWGADSTCVFAVADGSATLTLSSAQMAALSGDYAASATELVAIGTYADGTSFVAYFAHDSATPWKVGGNTTTGSGSSADLGDKTDDATVIPTKVSQWPVEYASLDVYDNSIGIFVTSLPEGFGMGSCGFYAYTADGGKSFNNGHVVDKEITAELGRFVTVDGGFVCVVDGTHDSDEGVVFLVAEGDVAAFHAATTQTGLGATMWVPDPIVWQQGSQPGTTTFEYLNDSAAGPRIRYSHCNCG